MGVNRLSEPKVYGSQVAHSVPGAIYHQMNRGDHQETIFCDDEDRLLFMATLAEGCQKTAWQVHSFCLMSNHFHLVIETPNANLVEGMKWFLLICAQKLAQINLHFTSLFSCTRSRNLLSCSYS
jgi:REP element-mobilizing transposase RayT